MAYNCIGLRLFLLTLNMSPEKNDVSFNRFYFNFDSSHDILANDVLYIPIWENVYVVPTVKRTCNSPYTTVVPMSLSQKGKSFVLSLRAYLLFLKTRIKYQH